MAKLTIDVTGLDMWERDLTKLQGAVVKVAKKSLYDGAAVMADNLRAAVNGLNRVTDAAFYQAVRNREMTLISVSQKNGLRKGLAVAPM